MIRPTVAQLAQFLRRVDAMFPVPLSQKQNLDAFAEKLYEKATICAEMQQDEILALAVGYTEQVIENRGYLSVVATLPEGRGKGYASKLIRQFLTIAEGKQLSAVHLYADSSNAPALAMYRKLGFTEWQMPDEPRPQDVHFIYYFGSVEKHI